MPDTNKHFKKVAAAARPAVKMPGASLPAVHFVAGKPALALASYDVASLGYSEEEFFVSGMAQSFAAPEAALGPDGRWSVSAADVSRFETRIVVLRPLALKRFSGTVIVEWLNVSAGMDSPPDWLMTHREVVRSGHAYVGVSCQ